MKTINYSKEFYPFLCARLGRIYLSLLVLVLSGCKDTFQFSPNAASVKEYEKNINARNIAAIEATPVDTIKFIFIADIQYDYEALENFVAAANQVSDARFVLVGGDITNFGLLEEYRETNDRLKKLNIPYVSIAGNHDLLGNGKEVFTQMMGPLDFSFRVGNIKFIGLNTNSREEGFPGNVPDMNWLRQELADTVGIEQVIVSGHVPPYDSGFDPALEEEYRNSLAGSGKVQFSLYGHRHSFSDEDRYNDGLRYIVSDDVGDRKYLLVKAWNSSFSVEEKTF